jgi:RNA polymerase sigma-70 factor (ECF subfamily)
MYFVKGKGAKKQFIEIFMPLIDKVYNFALRMTRNPIDAEDLVQDTFLKAFRFRAHYQEKSNPSAWILTIMTNIFRTGYRKKQREPIQVNFDDVDDFYSEDAFKEAERPANRSEVHTDEYISEYLKFHVTDDVINAIDNIPEQFRMAVLFSDVERFDYKEIAEILGVNLGTVKSRIFRGRKMMQKQLRSYAQARESRVTS